MSSADDIELAEALPKAQPPLLVFGKELLANRSFLIGFGLFLLIALLSIFADLVAPYNP